MVSAAPITAQSIAPVTSVHGGRPTLSTRSKPRAGSGGTREKSRNASLKDLVNEALRRGLKDMTSRAKRRERLQTRSVALGRLRIASLDNIGEALAVAEGAAYK